VKQPANKPAAAAARPAKRRTASKPSAPAAKPDVGARGRPKPIAAHADVQRQSARPDDDVAFRAVDAIGGAEDIGGLGLRDLIWSFAGAIAKSDRLTSEARGLAAELTRIVVGRSELAPARGDWRFKDPAWSENPAYRRLAQIYLAASAGLERIPE
jgi:hypothetical protein